MVEVSAVIFTLLIEAVVLLLLILGGGIFLIIRQKRKDKAAAHKLVDQIKQQSDARKKQMGAYLAENYQLEEDELVSAVELVDKAEKKFFQQLINLYLKRDSEELSSIDAKLAEVIGVYKSFKPVEVEKEVEQEGSAAQEELDQLQKMNDHLTEELKITKETMNNMIAEFGNMFGGGAKNELDEVEVIEKVVGNVDQVETNENVSDSGEMEYSGDAIDSEFVVGQEEPSSDHEEALEEFDPNFLIDGESSPSDAEESEQSEVLSDEQLEAFMAETDDNSDIDAEDIAPPQDSSGIEPESIDDILEQGKAEASVSDNSITDNQASDGEQKVEGEPDDITGIDIGSDEDIDKLLEDLDINR